MAYQDIGRGSAANDGTGDDLRTGAGKINANFVELYTLLGDGTTLHGLTFPNATDTVVTLAETQTLTNKTLTAPVLGGDVSTASGNLTVDPATAILEVKGDGSSVDGKIKLNCHVNSHGQTLSAQPHSASVTNTMLLPAGADSTLVSEVATQTLTNKTIDLTDNTVTGTTAEFNTALSDGDFATLAGTETLTNKSLTSPTITGSGSIAATDVTAEITLGGTAPSSASDTGTAGDIRYDADYIYVCVATDTWKRVAISTW